LEENSQFERAHKKNGKRDTRKIRPRGLERDQKPAEKKGKGAKSRGSSFP